MAQKLGDLRTCDRAKMGAIITLRGRAVSWGYNGAPPRLPHCEDVNHGWHGGQLAGKKLYVDGVVVDVVDEGLYDDLDEHVISGILRRAAERYGCRNATHAEANAIAFAARQGISTEGGTLYVVQSPCLNCARLLIASGIRRVVWATTYRDPAGSELLEAAGVAKDVVLPLGHPGVTE